MSYPDLGPGGTPATRRPTTPEEVPQGGIEELRGAMRSALRQTAVLAVVLAVVGAAVGSGVDGGRGAAGALLGAGLAAAFFAVTAASVLLTARSTPAVAAAGILGSWLAKIVVTLGLLIAIRGQDWYHPGVFLVTLAVAVVGTLAVETRAVLRARVPYVAGV